MKKLLKRVAGVVAAVVGTAGVVLSVLAIVHTWRIAERLRHEVPEVLDRLQGITGAVHEQGQSTISLLETARERVASISDTIEELSHRPPGGGRPGATSILQTLDVEQQLEMAEEVIVSMENSVRSMSSALLLLDSFPFLKPWMPPVEGQQESPLKTVAGSLNQTADLLEQATRAMARIRSGQSIDPARLAQLQQTLGHVDRGLDEVQSEVRVFAGGVEQTRAQLKGLRDEVPHWINKTSLIVCGFFLCFGFSQISLVFHGLQWLFVRRRSSGTVPGS